MSARLPASQPAKLLVLWETKAVRTAAARAWRSETAAAGRHTRPAAFYRESLAGGAAERTALKSILNIENISQQELLTSVKRRKR